MKPPKTGVGFGFFLRPPGFWGILILFLFVPLIPMRWDPTDYTPVIGYSSEAQSVRNTSAIARLFGEFRTSMSDILFIKTERYIHSGIGYAPHITEKNFSDPESGKKNLSGIPTLIKPPEKDWRGFIGDIERAVKPWMDPKIHMAHDKGTELLPWFRLMTLVNPHRIRGYRIGAFLMMTQPGGKGMQQAWDFIQEGIRNNPDSHELQYMLVRLLQSDLMYQRAFGTPPDEETERKYLKTALFHARKAIELGAKKRPEGGWKGKGRPAEMEDAFAACLHLEVFLLRRLGRNREALDAALKSIERFGSDPVLENEVKELRDLLEGQQDKPEQNEL